MPLLCKPKPSGDGALIDKRHIQPALAGRRLRRSGSWRDSIRCNTGYQTAYVPVAKRVQRIFQSLLDMPVVILVFVGRIDQHQAAARRRRQQGLESRQSRRPDRS